MFARARWIPFDFAPWMPQCSVSPPLVSSYRIEKRVQNVSPDPLHAHSRGPRGPAPFAWLTRSRSFARISCEAELARRVGAASLFGR